MEGPCKRVLAIACRMLLTEQAELLDSFTEALTYLAGQHSEYEEKEREDCLAGLTNQSNLWSESVSEKRSTNFGDHLKLKLKSNYPWIARLGNVNESINVKEYYHRINKCLRFT